MFYEKVVFLFGFEEKSFKNKKKILKKDIDDTMRHSHQKKL